MKLVNIRDRAICCSIFCFTLSIYSHQLKTRICKYLKMSQFFLIIDLKKFLKSYLFNFSQNEIEKKKKKSDEIEIKTLC